MSTDQAETRCDLLIVGGGLAGACLARQLRLRLPQLHIVQLEKKTDFDYWVGESTVEVWEYYATKLLKLGPYLEKHHFLKNGLRFFFDSENKDLPMEKLSEVGRRWYFAMPSRQLDRAAFDRDMGRMNQELGVDYRLGVTVEGVSIDRKNGHVVKTSDGTFRCRWFVDAGGRSSPLERFGYCKVQKDDPRHQVASYWARYENCKVIDECGSDAWRARVGYGHRYLSTTHFMYRGYWIWLIPVTDTIVSIGVAINRAMFPEPIRNVDELTAFFRKHKALDEILGEKAVGLDFFGLKQLTRISDKILSEDRWFHTGMSGLFVDPLYSSTCATIARTNMFIEHLIRADLEGDEDKYMRRLRHFEYELHIQYEIFVRIFEGHKDWGALDSFITTYWWTLHVGYNMQLPDLFHDFARSAALADAHGLECDCSREKVLHDVFETGIFAAHKRWNQELVAFLDAHKKFYDRNEDIFFENYSPRAFVDKMLDSSLAAEAAFTEKIMKWTYQYPLRRMADIEGLPFDAAECDRQFASVYERMKKDPSDIATLAEGLEALRAAGRDRRDKAFVPTPRGAAATEAHLEEFYEIWGRRN